MLLSLIGALFIGPLLVQPLLGMESPGSSPNPYDGNLTPSMDGSWLPRQPENVDTSSHWKGLKTDRRKQKKIEQAQLRQQGEVVRLLQELEASRIRDIRRMERFREKLRTLPRSVQELIFDNHVEISRLCGLLRGLGCPPPPEASITDHQFDPLTPEEMESPYFSGGNGKDSSTLPASLFSSRPISPSPRRGRSSRRMWHRGHDEQLDANEAHSGFPTAEGQMSPLLGREEHHEEKLERKSTRSSLRSSPTPRGEKSRNTAAIIAGQQSPIAPRIPAQEPELYKLLLKTEVEGWKSGYEIARIQGSQKFDRDIAKALRELRIKKELEQDCVAFVCRRDTIRKLEHKFNTRLEDSIMRVDKEVLRNRLSDITTKISDQCDLVENDLTSETQNLQLGYITEIGDHWQDADLQLRRLSEDFAGGISYIGKAAETKRCEAGQKIRDDHERCIKDLVNKYIDELKYQYQSGSAVPKKTNKYI
eukprot:jgi/Bigna1/72217/fgenesh1_pg.19_\